ncbi:hypothetical protein GDO86_015625 [Hymenochirus boettgeri]|nr:hypothetical protein GDO86_015625 [Hymenochirus boettgeri]KAG8448605.1 hypothetical protein GDO86_015625 [Hymenochirus boettgeri]
MRDTERDPEERESERDANRGEREAFEREPPIKERDRGKERDRDREKEKDRDRSDKDREKDRERDRDEFHRRSDSFPEFRTPRKGNTVYVRGVGMNQTVLRDAFSSLGKIIDLSVDAPRNCAFVTFESIESADLAVDELNNKTIEDIPIKVSIARKQPMLEAALGKSVWGSLAVKNNTKGSVRSKRSWVSYSEDLFTGNQPDGDKKS